ncbi:MAG: sensor histidine kinase [Ramlibacter sp.]
MSARRAVGGLSWQLIRSGGGFPFGFAAALAAVLALVALGELSYRLAIRTLGDASPSAHDGVIAQYLVTSRVIQVLLGLISLGALFVVLYRGVTLRAQHSEQKRLLERERVRLEADALLRTTQLIDLTRHLQLAREDERGRLARDLHDELGSLLTSAKLDVARIRPRLPDAAPELLERLDHLVRMLDTGIALKRNLVEGLQPSSLKHLGLVTTLEILMREFSAQTGVVVHASLEPVRLDTDAQLMVYRMVQEAITNISKYARAGEVWLGLSAHQGVACITVRDDGVGFDTALAPASAYGLVGMRVRVEAEHGALRVTSAPGQGTLIQVTLPEAPPVAAPEAGLA